jgi:ADP-ribosylation factor-like protein 8
MRQVTRGSVTFKLWDLSGQAKFRPTWTRYCLGVGVLVFVVDSADVRTFAVARDELHSLLKELPRVVRRLIQKIAHASRVKMLMS